MYHLFKRKYVARCVLDLFYDIRYNDNQYSQLARRSIERVHPGCNDNRSNISRRTAEGEKKKRGGRRDAQRKKLGRRGRKETLEKRYSCRGASGLHRRVFRGRLFLRLTSSPPSELWQGNAPSIVLSSKERDRDTPSRLPVNTRAPVIRGSCVLINPGCARARKRSENYTIAPLALISRNYTGCGAHRTPVREPRGGGARPRRRSLIKCIACTHVNPPDRL